MSELIPLNCPKCGSPDLKALKNNFYKCDHCGTTSKKEFKDQHIILVISEAPKRSVPLWAQIVVWIGLVALLALVGFGLQRRQNPMAVIGEPVPNFDLVYFEGYEYNGIKQMKLSDLRDKVVVINIWASWCKPCEQEAPELEEAWQFYKDSGDVVFIGVDYVDTPAGANEYLKKFNITFPNAPDLKSNISSILNRQMGVPETYFIDRNGILRHVKIGPFVSLDEIKAVIEEIQ